mmetsp:Transcript_86706/g.240481  ORF Transcript_86706/g.240481 Transcript_86706/m.240481 type:complete len:211 (+) Transcript_86706:982-1614(+)
MLGHEVDALGARVQAELRSQEPCLQAADLLRQAMQPLECRRQETARILLAGCGRRRLTEPLLELSHALRQAVHSPELPSHRRKSALHGKPLLGFGRFGLRGLGLGRFSGLSGLSLGRLSRLGGVSGLELWRRHVRERWRAPGVCKWRSRCAEGRGAGGLGGDLHEVRCQAACLLRHRTHLSLNLGHARVKRPQRREHLRLCLAQRLLELC